MNRHTIDIPVFIKAAWPAQIKYFLLIKAIGEDNMEALGQ
jgi:hypothetical protein